TRTKSFRMRCLFPQRCGRTKRILLLFRCMAWVAIKTRWCERVTAPWNSPIRAATFSSRRWAITREAGMAFRSVRHAEVEVVVQQTERIRPLSAVRQMERMQRELLNAGLAQDGVLLGRTPVERP